MSARGRLLLITAPSGAGKTSLVRELLRTHPNLRFSISYTTRPRRPNEVEGRDYHFVDAAEFARMLEAGEFLEHAKVFDYCYGTSRRQVIAELDQGHDVLLEIDWQGAAQVRAAMPEVLSIFILPPSCGELERRLRSRATDSEAVIQRRLRDAVGDMSHCREFEYAVVNDDFQRAVDALAGILAGHGQASRTTRPELQPLLTELLD
ncbi:MAG: guanylate kinase [Gammaproteobacteria bacterium]|nr:guanylate kinase [Gammaproteobacteria bacterium]